jgi:hypothetical protein
MTDTPMRANYALISVQEHLGVDPDILAVPWAEFVGNRSTEYTFTVPSGSVVDPYVELQVFDIDAYNHEILINGDALSGFDIPPASGWQYWMDTITGATLVEGENVLRFARDSSTEDDFVVGAVTVHWREPID